MNLYKDYILSVQVNEIGQHYILLDKKTGECLLTTCDIVQLGDYIAENSPALSWIEYKEEEMRADYSAGLL